MFKGMFHLDASLAGRLGLAVRLRGSRLDLHRDLLDRTPLPDR